MSSRDALRVVWLFGKPYWWDVQPGQPLVLRPAAWITKEAARA